MLKWSLVGLAVLVALVLGALLALPLLLDTPAIQAYASQAASHALGRPVKFKSLDSATDNKKAIAAAKV